MPRFFFCLGEKRGEFRTKSDGCSPLSFPLFLELKLFNFIKTNTVSGGVYCYFRMPFGTFRRKGSILDPALSAGFALHPKWKIGPFDHGRRFIDSLLQFRASNQSDIRAFFFLLCLLHSQKKGCIVAL